MENYFCYTWISIIRVAGFRGSARFLPRLESMIRGRRRTRQETDFTVTHVSILYSILAASSSSLSNIVIKPNYSHNINI